MIEFLFSNPLIIIVLLGLINFLFSKDKTKEETKQERQRPIERQKPIEIPDEVNYEQIERAEAQTYAEEEYSIEDLREQQLERLSKTLSYQSDMVEEAKSPKEAPSQILETKKTPPSSRSSSSLQGRLTERGLIDSVIMSEVLGQPRALKPYENAYTRKFNRHS